MPKFQGKITPSQECEVLERAAQGMSSGAIAAWLGTEYGVRISGAAIRARLADTRDERSLVTKAVVRGALVRVVTSDLDALERERRRCQRLARRVYRIAMDGSETAVNSDAADLYLRVLDRVVKMVDLRLHYAGADSADGESNGVELPADPVERASVLRALAEHEENKSR